MSKHVSQSTKKVTIKSIAAKYQANEKLTMVTCYDASFAKIVDASPIDMVLVGDSLGNVMLGYDSTIPVTMTDMVHHSAAVSRVMKKQFITGDMPFLSYQQSVQQAVENAGILVQKGGVHSVKLEGGSEICPQIEAITRAGIPVIGHLGLTPQSVHALGGYRVQGRGDDATQLLREAEALASAGAFAVVLELVPSELAKAVTERISVPTIGIGAGVHTSGQVLVLQDLLGFDSGFKPKFLKHYANIGEMAANALAEYAAEVQSGSFPGIENSFQ